MFMVHDYNYHDYIRFATEDAARQWIAEQIEYYGLDKSDFKLYKTTELEI